MTPARVAALYRVTLAVLALVIGLTVVAVLLPCQPAPKKRARRLAPPRPSLELSPPAIAKGDVTRD